jgi:chromosome segregation ATPase
MFDYAMQRWLKIERSQNELKQIDTALKGALINFDTEGGINKMEEKGMKDSALKLGNAIRALLKHMDDIQASFQNFMQELGYAEFKAKTANALTSYQPGSTANLDSDETGIMWDKYERSLQIPTEQLDISETLASLVSIKQGCDSISAAEQQYKVAAADARGKITSAILPLDNAKAVDKLLTLEQGGNVASAVETLKETLDGIPKALDSHNVETIQGAAKALDSTENAAQVIRDAEKKLADLSKIALEHETLEAGVLEVHNGLKTKVQQIKAGLDTAAETVGVGGGAATEIENIQRVLVSSSDTMGTSSNAADQSLQDVGAKLKELSETALQTQELTTAANKAYEESKKAATEAAEKADTLRTTLADVSKRASELVANLPTIPTATIPPSDWKSECDDKKRRH